MTTRPTGCWTARCALPGSYSDTDIPDDLVKGVGSAGILPVKTMDSIRNVRKETEQRLFYRAVREDKVAKSQEFRVYAASHCRSYARAAISMQRTRYLECGGSTPLFSGPPRRPEPREPRLAAQGGAKAPHSIKMPGWHHVPVPIIDFLRLHQINSPRANFSAVSREIPSISCSRFSSLTTRLA